MNVIDAISQRKTIKAFDRKTTISREQIEEMLQLTQLAPSKANLQPWRFVVLDSPESKAQILDLVAFNSLPCETASAVVLILADLHYHLLLDDILDNSIKQGSLQPHFRENSFNFLTNLHQQLSEQEIRDQVITDASLAAMQLMLIVKEKGFDSHAIGIFDKDAVLKTLNVDSNRYVPIMLLAIGKAAFPAAPSSRLPLDYTLSWHNGLGFKK